MARSLADIFAAQREQVAEQVKPMGRSLSDVMAANKAPEREVLLSPWLVSGTLNMIYAPSGLGKTFVSLCVAFAIATGREFMGWQAPCPRKVLYIDGEMGTELLGERLKGIVEAQRATVGGEVEGLSNLRFITEDDFPEKEMPNLSDPSQQQFYSDIIEDADFVIIDNFDSVTDLLDAKDTDFNQWRRVRSWAQRHRNEGKTILFVHHSNKAGGQHGTASRERPMHVIISLRPCAYGVESSASNCFELHFEKGRELSKEQKQPLFVEQLNVEQCYDGAIYPDGGIKTEPQTIKLLHWRHAPLADVRKRVCQRLQARSGYPKPTYKELAHMLGIPWAEAQEIWDSCSEEVVLRKSGKPRKRKSSLPDMEINLDGIEV